MVNNTQVVLKSRPQGLPQEQDFELSEAPLRALSQGQYRVHNRFLSMDAGFLHWMFEGSSDNYMPQMEIGDAVRSLCMGYVTESRHADFAEGDLVMGRYAWETYATGDDASFANKVEAESDMPLEYYLGVLGGTGMTAYFGMQDIGMPGAGDNVWVSAAAGAVGVVAGQIARIKGARVVGTCGANDKCDKLVNEYGFDAAINYREVDNLGAALDDVLPEGIDVYFDNVGGKSLELAIDRLRERARIVLCGSLSGYTGEAAGTGPANLFNLVTCRARMEGFMYTDSQARYPEAHAALCGWLRSGELKDAQYRLEGIESAGKAFCHMFQGKNFGKTLVAL